MQKLASILIVLLSASHADAGPKKSEKAAFNAHVERAAKAHQAGELDVALAELEAAYAIDPQPKLLYAIAQVHAKLGSCAEAVAFYEKFLATVTDKQRQAVVRQAIAACTPRQDDRPADPAVFRSRTQETDEPAPKPVELAPAKEAEPRTVEEPPLAVDLGPGVPAARSPWYRDPLGDALVLAGVGATVASYLVYRAASADLDKAEASPTLAEYEDLVDRAHRKRMYSVVLAGGGVALVAGGILRFALRDSGREARGVAIVPAAGGGLVTWSGGF